MSDDRELVLKLQAGSLEALGILYDRHQRMVFRTALAITGDPEAAADLQQDVFLRLFRFAGKVDAERPLEPWLYRVTANQAYTWVKRRSRWLTPLEDFADWLVSGVGQKASLQQEVEANETDQVISRAVLSLPISHRIVVVLYYINDLSLQEIAEILDLPVGTVKSRLYYGRQALRSQLGLLVDNALPEIEIGYEFT